MDLLRDYALSFVGKPYIWGGEHAAMGYDCSGISQEILASAGEDPQGDQTAQGLFDWFSTRGQWDKWGCGALAFYGASAKQITHVAFCLDTYRCIEAGGGGSKTLTVEDAIKQGAMVRVRLIKRRSDLQAVIRPHYSGIGLF